MVLSSNKVAIENLEAAYDGVTMRQALIDLIETFSEVGGDVKNLGGRSFKYYVLVSELDSVISEISNWLQYDTEPMEGSRKLLKNKDFTSYFQTNILEKLKQINGDMNGDYSKAPADQIGSNISECLTYLNTDIGLIEAAIEHKGVQIQQTDSVMDLPERIAQIKLGALNVIPITISENGKVIPSDIVWDGDVPISGTAYNPVTVAIQQKGYETTITSNGNHTPPEGYDGFSRVEVKVPTSGSGSGSGSGGEGTLKLATQEILDNGNYNPPSGYEGFSEVNVNVTNYELPEEKECKVTFTAEDADGNVTSKEITVMAGQRAVYGDEPPRYDDTDFWYFRGWNPTPKKVVTDMEVTAEYNLWTPGNNFMGKAYTWCNNSWKELLGSKGTIGIGELKLLRLKDNNIVTMMYVGNGRFLCLNYRDIPGNVPVGTGNWENEPLRDYLNEDFFETYIPDWLKSYIKTETKIQAQQTDCLPLNEFYGTFVNNLRSVSTDLSMESLLMGVVAYGIQYNMGTSEKVWIPSVNELNLIGGINKGDFYSGKYTSNNVSYNSVYRTQYEVYPGSDPPEERLRYYRTGFVTGNIYGKCGRKETTIPSEFQAGLVRKNHQYNDALDPSFPSSILNTWSLNVMQSMYRGGSANKTASQIVTESYKHYKWADTSMEPPVTYEPYDRMAEVYNRDSNAPLWFGGQGYTFSPYIDSNNVATNRTLALRDVVLRTCHLNDNRVNDQYDSSVFYTSPPNPIAEYAGGGERCVGVYARACLSPYGYLTYGPPNSFIWGITLANI